MAARTPIRAPGNALWPGCVCYLPVRKPSDLCTRCYTERHTEHEAAMEKKMHPKRRTTA